jgi:hypothetical protein
MKTNFPILTILISAVVLATTITPINASERAKREFARGQKKLKQINVQTITKQGIPVLQEEYTNTILPLIDAIDKATTFDAVKLAMENALAALKKMDPKYTFLDKEKQNSFLSDIDRAYTDKIYLDSDVNNTNVKVTFKGKTNTLHELVEGMYVKLQVAENALTSPTETLNAANTLMNTTIAPMLVDLKDIKTQFIDLVTDSTTAKAGLLALYNKALNEHTNVTQLHTDFLKSPALMEKEITELIAKYLTPTAPDFVKTFADFKTKFDIINNKNTRLKTITNNANNLDPAINPAFQATFTKLANDIYIVQWKQYCIDAQKAYDDVKNKTLPEEIEVAQKIVQNDYTKINAEVTNDTDFGYFFNTLYAQDAIRNPYATAANNAKNLKDALLIATEKLIKDNFTATINSLIAQPENLAIFEQIIISLNKLIWTNTRKICDELFINTNNPITTYYNTKLQKPFTDSLNAQPAKTKAVVKPLYEACDKYLTELSIDLAMITFTREIKGIKELKIFLEGWQKQLVKDKEAFDKLAA